MPSSRDLPSLLPAVLKIFEEAQSKIEGGILKLLPIFLLLVFFFFFIPTFLVKIWFQIDNFHNYLDIWIKIGKSSISPAQLYLDQEAGGFLLAHSLLKTDALPVHHTTAEGGDTLETTKLQVYNFPCELNNFSLRRRVPRGGLKKWFKVQEWKWWIRNYRIFYKSVLISPSVCLLA